MLVLRNTFAAFSLSLALLSGLAAASDDSALNPTRQKPHSLLSERGPIHDIADIIKCKKKIGQDFCTTFLHLPPYAATKTVTITTVIGKTAPASTVTASTAITSTASAQTVVNTQTAVVAVTPTTEVTSVSVVPSTSFVSGAITSTVTGSPVTVTVTSTTFTLGPRNAGHLTHNPHRTRLPYWLNQYPCSLVSKACSQVVTSKTTTVTKTATAVTTKKAATTTVALTGTSFVTPTTTVVTTVTSTSTAAAVTSAAVVVSSSIVPATSTIDVTVQPPTVTATQVISSPGARLRISKPNGDVQGYIRATLQEAAYVMTDDPTQALVIPIPQNGGPQNIAVPGGQYPYLGAINQPNLGMDADLSTSSGHYIILGQTAQVPAGSRAFDANSSHAQMFHDVSVYQSSVWNYDAVSNALSLTWTNSDGSTINPTFSALNEQIFFAGDLSKFPYGSMGPLSLTLEFAN